MKKYLQIVVVLGAFFLFVFVKNMKGSDDENQVVVLPTPTETPTPTPTPTPTFSSSTTPPPTQIPTATPKPQSGKYKDGSYTGSVEDAIYGNYQVKAVISGGKLTDIVPILYPNDNRTSLSINSQAFPLLRDEALKAQSSQIDIISGASDSSPAFARSLNTALKQAL